MAEIVVTEVKRIDIFKDCISNPVMLQWLNTQGGKSYWVFVKNANDNITTEAGGEFLGVDQDLENSIGGSAYLSKVATPSITVGSDIDQKKMDGIRGLLMSPFVLMLNNPDRWETEGAKWQMVKVQPGSFVITRRSETRIYIELIIMLNEINLQSE